MSDILQPVPKGGMFICRPQPLYYENGTVQGITLISDLHFGARNVDYDKIKEECELAKKKGDRININGDIFDMILVQDTKRYRNTTLHPRIAGKDDLVNQCIKWAAEFFTPYADLIDMIGVGNHESYVEKYHNTDAIKFLVYELNKQKKNKAHLIHYGGYSGFIDYRFFWKKNKNSKTGTQHSKRFVVYYHHGSGGGSSQSKGILDLVRKGWIDADLIWHGHKHHNFIAPSEERISCPLIGHDPIKKLVRLVQTGAYFDTYNGQSQESLEVNGRLSNYAADSGMSPSGKGGLRVELEFKSHGSPFVVRCIQ